MKKILFFGTIMLVPILIFSFKFVDEAPCFVIGSIGYLTVTTPDGTPPNPSDPNRIPGIYNPSGAIGTYNCVTNPTITCRFIYAITEEAPNGRWFQCSGARIHNLP
ncbi:hypothetical protein [Chitinophaga cymbidii]|uniref:Uncharacterized protein n=1 Tax=Chitinophaga cymbidii TaxID=1096750 RepID=A0A512RFN2_9BACT|nr:hypothetical protein [Chitinophaga cymbidii]GEP94519.1 hypothetical protein CCY01nite_07790 [Chitinophaga cymbidii]